MLIIIPRGRRTVTVYTCPRCHQRLGFFSWKPIHTPEWTCRRCGQKIQINSSCFAKNWAYAAVVWGIPPIFLLGGMLTAFMALMSTYPPTAPIYAPLAGAVIGFIMGGLAGVIVTLLPCILVGYIAGLVYGGKAVREREAKAAPARPRRKKKPSNS